MQQESRVKKTLLNARINLIYYILTLVLSFFSRKIFLDCLGADFVGLTGTLQNLLGVLNLAELGIGISIGYLLYKPLYEGDKEKICDIITIMGYLYCKIGSFILIAGLTIAVFLPVIFPSTQFDLGVIYFAYISFLTSTLIGYFINYRQNLLGADQKNYVVTVYYQGCYYLKTIIQMVIAYCTANYYYWIAIELGFGIIYSFILNWRINKTYPWLKTELRHGKQKLAAYPEVIKKTKQVFFHKISGFAQFQTTPILVYAFVSLQTVAMYGNYTILFDKVNVLINNLFGSVSASVGNLMAENNKVKILEVFWELFTLRYAVMGIISFGLLNFTNDFIRLWLGEDYILPDAILFILVLNQFLSMSRNINDPFIWGKGMFGDIGAPICETLIYISVALVGGYFLGLPGIILGNTASLFVIICMWKPYYLFRKGLKAPLSHYVAGWLKYTFLYGISIVSSYVIIDRYLTICPSTWVAFVSYCAIATAVFAIVYVGLFYMLSISFRKGIYKVIKR